MTLSPDMAAAIATNRFGLGARRGDIAAARPAPQRWLIDQLAGPSRTPAPIAALPASAVTLTQVQAQLRKRREMRRQGNAPERDATGPTVRERYRNQIQARTRNAVDTDLSYHERLVHFWSNHFAVSADKPLLVAVAGAMENEVVRRHLDGSFADLLLAAERHPAMLIYLDNIRSTGPNSTRGRRAATRRPEANIGLNENLAREILELHTLGVDGGYDQQDVTALARVLTGWTVARQGRESGKFTFQGKLHEPGAQRVLGRRYGQSGVAQGEAVLRDLATHPATASHLATKLARHFTGDVPPTSVVSALTETFLDTGGDLPSVHRTLVEAAGAWHHQPVKYKSPNDLVISTFRAFETLPDEARRTMASYSLLGQLPFRPGSPAGWPDTDADWRGGNALFQRIEWVNTVARRAARAADAEALGRLTLGATLTDATRTALRRAESPAQALTLLLASPDFQRR